MYGLFGKMRAQEGQREALIGHLMDGLTALRNLEGCYIYVISRDNVDPEGIWVTEVWRSQADHQASLKDEAIRTVISKARPLIADMPEHFEFTPVDGKGLPDNA